METSEINLHRDNEIFDNGTNANQWRIKAFSINGVGTTGHSHEKL